MAEAEAITAVAVAGGDDSGGGGGPAASCDEALQAVVSTDGGPSSHVATGHDNSKPKAHQGKADNRGDDRLSTRDHGRDHEQTASRDNDDSNGHRDHRHGHFVHGVWVWYGAPYAYNDCNWLRHRALATGTPCGGPATTTAHTRR